MNSRCDICIVVDNVNTRAGLLLGHQLQVKALKVQSRAWAQKLKAKDCHPCVYV